MRLRLGFLLLITVWFTGCMGNYARNIPPLTSSEYPSFGATQPLTESIEVKLPVGTGRTTASMTFTLLKGGQATTAGAGMDAKWNTALENQMVLTKYEADATLTFPQESKKLSFLVDAIHDLKGKEVKFDFVGDEKEKLFTDEELQKVKKQTSDQLKAQFSSLGKTVKTGDVLRYIRLDFEGLPRWPDSNKNPEIVKGTAVHNGQRVIVTEFTIEENVSDSSGGFCIRGKGFNLYDTESFVQIFGKSTTYIGFYTHEQGQLDLRQDITMQSDELQVKGIRCNQ